MNKHEEKFCPRCREVFICKVDDITNCQCSTVEVSKETRKFISKTNYDCFCKKCLVKLNTLTKAAKNKPQPLPELMIEGLHYYNENGRIVFTELYHILRGYCCKSGCRHCAYGYKFQR